MPNKVLSPACALCGHPTEELYHSVVGCLGKSLLWQDVVSLLSLQELLPSDVSIWLALTSFCCGSNLVAINVNVLVALDDEPWIASTTIRMVRQDHGAYSMIKIAWSVSARYAVLGDHITLQCFVFIITTDRDYEALLQDW
ncbi:hypothetical protein MAM1_0094c05005 [Mucor ambiguus]|uniref:Reverse transcriptase zinc-binding domain-containing protein n=1 Tax=Mucor ambiguus TaxID=91626 RepID=A0A0C9MDX2_9FUNG|nr:hypothetical protein MAM1_0094c05005 [Mucor ambiguus]